MKKILFSIMLFLSLLLHANETNTTIIPTDWQSLYKEKKYQDAYTILLSLADNNNSEAQYTLATMYKNGFGVDKNQGKALYYFLEAGRNGHASSQYNLGLIFENGEGIKVSKKEAIKWYSRSSQQGNIDAKYKLYLNDKTSSKVDSNNTKALEDLQTLADNNYPDAQFDLGRKYLSGDGIEQNKSKAIEYFQKSSKHNYLPSYYPLALMYYHGSGTEKDYQKTFKLLVLLENEKKGDAETLNIIQKMISNNLIEKYDTDQELSQLKKIADLGDKNAQYRAGEEYFKRNNYNVALVYYQKALKNKDKRVYASIGKLYERGHGDFKKDLSSAAKWYYLGAEAGDTAAILNLGSFFEQGIVFHKNKAKALGLYEYTIFKDGFASQEAVNLITHIVMNLERRDIFSASFTCDHIQKDGLAATLKCFEKK